MTDRVITIVDIKSREMHVPHEHKWVKVYKYDDDNRSFALDWKDMTNPNATVINKVYTYYPVRFRRNYDVPEEEVYFCGERTKEDSELFEILLNAQTTELQKIILRKELDKMKLETMPIKEFIKMRLINLGYIGILKHIIRKIKSWSQPPC